MRNCFVPGCDAFCKRNNMVSRKMFLPPKNPDLFEKWHYVLPNKRKLKAHDRVCERHFVHSDIIMFWESTINGQIHMTPRDKPKLKENSIPCKNLPKASDYTSSRSEQKDFSPKIEILSQSLIKTASKQAANEEIQNELSIPPGKKVKKDQQVMVESIIESVPDSELKDSEAPIISTTVEDSVHSQEIFDTFYDEAYDVCLPNCLWGLHRDPSRTFVVFSKFNRASMSHSISVFIENTFQYKIQVANQPTIEKPLQVDELTTDIFSNILNDLDKDCSSMTMASYF